MCTFDLCFLMRLLTAFIHDDVVLW